MNNSLIFPEDQNEFFKEHLIGKTIKDIKVGDENICFLLTDGSAMRFFHSQSCCESVSVDDICGDIDDLKDSPILGAELSSNSNTYGPKDKYDSSYTWSFYNFRTQKGYVTIRWYGSSNGYYSETVDIEYHSGNLSNDDWDTELLYTY